SLLCIGCAVILMSIKSYHAVFGCLVDVAKVTTIRTKMANGTAMTALLISYGLDRTTSHSNVTATPDIMDDSPADLVTRFHSRTPNTAGVRPAPYTVYAYICTSSMVGKKRIKT